jgi:hydroxypyruvate reductase
MKEIIAPTANKAINRAIVAALTAVHPGLAIKRYLDRQGDKLRVENRIYDLSALDLRLVVVGKGAIPMAQALADILGDLSSQAIVVTPSEPIGDNRFPPSWQILTAAHPIPDVNSVQAGDRVCELLTDCTDRTLIVAGISGGASALLVAPEEGISLATMQTINDALLRSGADIQAMNAVRARLDKLKAGGLVERARPGQVLGLILSDVIGDPIAVIASGLTHHPLAHNLLVGNNRQACAGAAQVLSAAGYRVEIVTTELAGAAHRRGREIARAIQHQPPGTALIYGGETTVTIPSTAQGKGGRNQELALAAVIELGSQTIPATMVTLATDGIDGPTDAAGAIVDQLTLQQARDRGLDPQDYLDRHDSYHFFAQLERLVITHPTGTNVADMTIAIRDR